MDRRQLLIGASALAAGASARAIPALAQAKPSQMVLMTWGGLWGDSMKEGCDTAFEKLTGVKIIQDRGSSPGERITKIKVAADDQKFDIVQLHDGIVPLAVSQGALEPINRSSPRLTNLKNVPDRVMLEGRFPAATFDALRRLGHDAQAWPDFTFQCGAVCAVLHDGASGVKIAAADPRRNTGVAGW